VKVDTVGPFEQAVLVALIWLGKAATDHLPLASAEKNPA
jgi:hypothetical protein